MQFVKELLDHKGRGYVSVTPDTAVCNAIMMMADRGIGSILVVDDGKLLGLFTEREFAHQFAGNCDTTMNIPVAQVMLSSITCVSPNQTINECMALMTDKRIRHLPVVSDGAIVGIVSIGDLVKAVISEQQFVIEQLEQYIAS